MWGTAINSMGLRPIWMPSEKSLRQTGFAYRGSTRVGGVSAELYGSCQYEQRWFQQNDGLLKSGKARRLVRRIAPVEWTECWLFCRELPRKSLFRRIVNALCASGKWRPQLPIGNFCAYSISLISAPTAWSSVVASSSTPHAALRASRCSVSPSSV